MRVVGSAVLPYYCCNVYTNTADSECLPIPREVEEMRMKTLKMLNLMKGSQASRFIADTTEPESKNFPTITEDTDDDYFFFDIDTDCESNSYSSDLYHDSDSNNSLSSDDFEPVKLKYQIRNPSTEATFFSDEEDQAAEEMFFMEL